MKRFLPQRPVGLAVLTALVAVATFLIVALLVSIFERRQEARHRFVKLVEVTEVSTDPEPWGRNFPLQYETYRLTAQTDPAHAGGNHSLPPSRLEQDPWLRRLYDGYPFSLDYREARGHAFMLSDQEASKRVTDAPQSGACLHCHSSIIPTYRRFGLETQGIEPTRERLSGPFDSASVLAGFEAVGHLNYQELHAELSRTPDRAIDPHGAAPDASRAHPVSCLDCHDPGTMRLRVTRPGFLLGIAQLARSDDPAPHLPSIQRWRDSASSAEYNPNESASRQEMRSFVCAQCHVEYYCGPRMPLTYPWRQGLKVEEIEREWEETRFADGEPFFDYVHQETGTPVFKAQHPEFELWSQGIHARAGVSCSDCHMPYEKQGATKFSSHWVRSPLLNLNRACQTCHHVPEAELQARVETIQQRTRAMTERAATAMTEMLDAIVAAQEAGASREQLAPVRALQRKAMWRLDFISSENSRGFHAGQEAMRILAESIDYSRQAQLAAQQAQTAPNAK